MFRIAACARFLALLIVLILFPVALRAQNNAAAAPPKPNPDVISLISKGLAAAGIYHWQEALQLYEKALAKARNLDDKTGEVAALNNIGTVYGSIGQPQKALTYYEQVLPLLEAAGDKQVEGVMLGNIGNMYSIMGQPQKASIYYEKWLRLLEADGDKRIESMALNSIGMIYAEIGQLQQALTYCEKALPLCRQVLDKRQEAVTLISIGVVYGYMGQPQKALTYFEQALPLSKASGDKQMEASALHNIVKIYSDIGQFQKTLIYCEQSLLLFKASGDKIGESSTLISIGEVYAEIGQPQKALTYCEKALALCHQSIATKEEAIALCDTGIALYEMGQPQKALEYAMQGMAQAAGYPRTAFYCQWLIGGAQQKLGHTPESIAAYRQAIEHLESIRGNVGGGEEARLTFLHSGNKVDVYEALIDLLVAQGDIKGALALLERARSKQLLDGIRLSSLTVADAHLRELLQQTESLEQQVAAQDKLRLAELAKPEAQQDKTRLANLTALVAGTRADLLRSNNAIIAANPNYKQFVTLEAPDLSVIQKRLPPDTVALTYLPLDTALVIFVITPTDIRAQSVAVSRQRLETLMQTFASQMQAAGAARSKLANAPDAPPALDIRHWDWNSAQARPLRDALTSLYSYLLAPVQGQIKAGQPLLIIPPDTLNGLPFGALAHEQADHSLRFVLQEHPLALLPRLRLWDQIAARSADATRPTGKVNGAAPPSAARLAVFGDPDGSLPGAGDEAKQIGALFPRSLVYLGADATRTHLTGMPPDVSMAHFATHGVLDADDANACYLVLANGDKLTLGDIYGLTFSARLTVLSACSTGVGGKNTHNASAHLADGFVMAGSQSVIASLWNVSDAATATLMTRFYQGMKNKQSVGAALQQAAQQVMNEPATRHPYFWAPFVLFGDWR